MVESVGSPITPNPPNNPILFTLHSENGFHFQSSIFREGFKISKGANFNTGMEIMGRSSPIVTYSNSGSMTLEVTLDLYALHKDPDGIAVRSVRDCTLSFLSLTFPRLPGVLPPPLCSITIGGSFESSILFDWQCVCTNVSTDYGKDQVWDTNGAAMSGSVTCSFLGVEIQSTPASVWLRQGAFAQMAFHRDGGIS